MLRTVEGEAGRRVITIIAARDALPEQAWRLAEGIGGAWQLVWHEVSARNSTWTFHEANSDDEVWRTRVRKHRERVAFDLAARGRQVTVEQLERDGHGSWWTSAMLDEIEAVLGRELGVPPERALDEYLARRRAGTPLTPKSPILPAPLAGVPLWLLAAESFATGAGLAVVGWLAGAGAAAVWFP